MNSKVFFGLYVPTNSILHRLDPRMKIIGCFWYVVIVFFANNLLTNVLLALFLLFLMAMSRVSFKMYWQGIRTLMWIILITAAVQLLFSTGGYTLWQWHFLTITSLGIIQSIYLIFRFAFIITISTVLTVTTTTLQLAAGIESLLRPLSYLKVPVSQLAMMLSIALRFIPTIMDEIQTIMDAQRARGMDFSAGNLFQRAKRLVPVMIPLFVSSFKRADDLALAMEARGYEPGAKRTAYRRLKWEKANNWALLVYILLTVVLIVLRHL